jgi:hypothetical protein
MPSYLVGVRPGDIIDNELLKRAKMTSSGCNCYHSDAWFFGLRSR